MSNKEESISKSKKSKKMNDIYMKSIITRNISLSIKDFGKNLDNIIKKKIKNMIEGKCIVEGYIKPESTKIISYSSGLIKGNIIVFEVVLECDVCNPVEGMQINCVIKNITKAGIRAEYDDDYNPIVVFIARDHHYTSEYFSTLEENQNVTVKVIGQRYELNDKYISIIAELVEENKKTKRKPKLVLSE